MGFVKDDVELALTGDKRRALQLLFKIEASSLKGVVPFSMAKSIYDLVPVNSVLCAVLKESL